MYMGGRVDVHYYLIYSHQFGGHIERWSSINTIGLESPIFFEFFPAAVCLSRKLQVALLVYLNMTYPTLFV